MEFISPPRADHIQIAKYIIIVTSLFFVPYISVLLGTTLFSLGFSIRAKLEDNALFARFAKDLVDTLYGNWWVAFVLAVLPVATLALSFSQVLYGTDANIGKYFVVIFFNVILALIVLFFYRESFDSRDSAFVWHAIFGFLALGGMMSTLFAYASTVTLVLFPERWPLIESLIPLTFDWNVVAKFTFLATAALAVTGAATLFFFFNWMGGKSDMDETYRDYVRKFGSGVTLGFSILGTVFFLWYLVTLPVMAKSYGVYVSAIIAVLVVMLTTIFSYFLLRDAQSGHGSTVFVSVLVFFLVVLVHDNLARENSLHYQNYALEKINYQIMAEIEAARTERSGAVASVQLGEEIFNSKCIACHRFDQKLVGPPYNEVLPKYEGDLEKLKQFILNPVKVNPEYIPMPSQGLKPHEAESAAMYLLEEFKKQKGQ